MTTKSHIKIDTTIHYQNVHPIDEKTSVLTDCSFIQDNNYTSLVINANVYYIDKVITLVTCDFKIRNDVDYLITNSIGALKGVTNLIADFIKVNNLFKNKLLKKPKYWLTSKYIIAINGVGNCMEYCGVFNSTTSYLVNPFIAPKCEYYKYGLDDIIDFNQAIPIDTSSLDTIVCNLVKLKAFINETILPKIEVLKLREKENNFYMEK